MITLNSGITIQKDNSDKFYFRQLVECSVSSGWDNITTTAQITLRNAFLKNNENVKTEIQRGQAIDFELGYVPKLTNRFSGFISKINTDSPFTIFAEGIAWKLKQKAITKYSKKNLTVSVLINDLLALIGETLTINVIDAGIGTWQVQNMTIINVLDELKSKFGFRSFFRDGELFIGYPNALTVAYPTKYGQNEHDFYFDSKDANIINHSLEWNDEADIKQVIKGTLIQPDNTQVTKYAYYLNGKPTLTTTQPEGNMITRFQYNILQADMDTYLLEELQLINYTGWKGSFTTFGDKITETLGGIIQHGDKVTLHSKKEPEKNGKYVVKHVSLSFGIQGYRQTATLDRQII